MQHLHLLNPMQPCKGFICKTLGNHPRLVCTKPYTATQGWSELQYAVWLIWNTWQGSLELLLTVVFS
jgi:hypothetical protein